MNPDQSRSIGRTYLIPCANAHLRKRLKKSKDFLKITIDPKFLSLTLHSKSKTKLFMEIKDLICNIPYLKDWKYYYAHLVENTDNDWVKTRDCPVAIFNDTLYILNAKGQIIQKSGRPLGDILLIAELIEELLEDFKKEHGVRIYGPDPIVVGLIVDERLRKIKQARQEEQAAKPASTEPEPCQFVDTEKATVSTADNEPTKKLQVSRVFC